MPDRWLQAFFCGNIFVIFEAAVDLSMSGLALGGGIA